MNPAFQIPHGGAISHVIVLLAASICTAPNTGVSLTMTLLIAAVVGLVVALMAVVLMSRRQNHS